MAEQGRTTWRPKPCGWRDRERVVALGEEFGPAGPLVLDVLEEFCKEQRGEEADGAMRAGLRSIGRAAFLPRGEEGLELARRILTFAEQVGAVDDLAITDAVDMTVTCRVSGFAADHGRGKQSVERSNRRAAEKADESSDSHPSLSASGGQCPDSADSVPPHTTHTEHTTAAASGLERGGKVVKVTFGGERVPDGRRELAERLLAAFNATANRHLDPYTARGRPSDALTRILGALTDWPDVTEEEWLKVIRVGFARPYWTGKAKPGNVFGPGVVQDNIEAVRKRAPAPAANGAGSGMDFFNRRGEDDDA